MQLYMEAFLPKNDEHMQAGHVIGWDKHSWWNIKGRFDPNIFVNTIIYDVMFPDVYVYQYGANIISEKLFSKVDRYR